MGIEEQHMGGGDVEEMVEECWDGREMVDEGSVQAEIQV